MQRNLKVPQNQGKKSELLERKGDFKETFDIINEYIVQKGHEADIGNIYITRKHPRIKEWK